MTITEINEKRQEIIAEAIAMGKEYKTIFGSISIEEPMSEEEKSMKRAVAAKWSEAQTLLIQKQQMVKAA